MNQPPAAAYLAGLNVTQPHGHGESQSNYQSAATMMGISNGPYQNTQSSSSCYNQGGVSNYMNSANYHSPQTNSPVHGSNSNGSLPSYLSGIAVSGPTGMGVSGTNSQPPQSHYSPQHSNFPQTHQPNISNPSYSSGSSGLPSYMMGMEVNGPTGMGIQASNLNTPPVNMPIEQQIPPSPQHIMSPPMNMNSPQQSANLGYPPTMNTGFNGPVNPPPMANMGHFVSAPVGPGPMHPMHSPMGMPHFNTGFPQPQVVRTGGNMAHSIGGNGKRRALILGINYINCRRGKLKGCINDARNLSRFVAEHFGFREIRVMTDDLPIHSPDHPTKANIISAMNWLVGDAKPGDSFFFHFSGHGGQSEDKTHLEDDGLNETILPADWETQGMIVDDDLHDMLVRGLPEGSRFTAIFDSCHSGTALDLPYVYKVQYGQFKNAHKAEEDRFWGRHKAKMKEQKISGVTGAVKALSSHVTGEVSHQAKKKLRNGIMRKLNTTKAIVVMFSGCRDDQTSADTTLGNQATGAMSYAFMQTLQNHQGVISYADLLAGMREALHNGPKSFTQLPQLSHGRPMDMSQPFTM